jgi:uncharacterized Zn finger protein (UPF0148 family)
MTRPDEQAAVCPICGSILVARDEALYCPVCDLVYEGEHDGDPADDDDSR